MSAVQTGQRLNFGLTYRGLVVHLAEQPGANTWSRPGDLPELTLEQLAAVLAHYPGALLEAICQFDPTCTTNVRDYLADGQRSDDPRLSLVGLVVVCALRQYVTPIVLRDVQMQVENNILLDRFERDPRTYDVLTADQLQAFELGLGRGH